MAIETDILLSKWYQRTITIEELRVLESEYDLAALSETLKGMEQLELEVVPAELGWSALELMMEIEQPDTAGSVQSSGLGRRKYLLWSLIAVVLAIAAYLFLSSRDTVIKNEGHEEMMYAFSEGSQSLISPGSRISYDDEGFEESRQISLSGEAFFQVTTGESFSVKTASGLITVLGTAFDVWQISDHTLRVECYEGRVSVQSAQGQKVILSAQEAVYIRQDNLEAKSKIDRQLPDWKTQTKQYVGITVKDLIRDVSRFYDYQLILKDIDQSDLFTGVIPINDIEKTADYLATTLGLQYEKRAKSYIFTQK